jgi:hypothetical protein
VSSLLLWMTIGLLPLLVPHGPGNTAPVDVFAGGFIVLTLLALVQRGRRLAVPAGPALALIVAGSLVALAFSRDSRTALLTLLVDVYLLLLLVAIANHLDGDPRALRAVLAVWTASAAVWAAVLIGVHWQLLPRVFAQLLNIPEGAKRAAGSTGNNPNLAASYLMTSFFILLASPWPRRRPVRWVLAAWLLLGLFATGSLGGLLGLVAGMALLTVGLYLRGGRTARQVQALAGAALLAGALAVAALLAVAGLPRFSLAEVTTVSAQAKQGVLADSVGRASRSLAGRLGLWSAAVAKAGPQALVGIGPGTAKTELQISNGRVDPDGVVRVHSLHNDYLAFLVERGLLGLAGLLALYAALLRRSLRVAVTARGVGVMALAAGVLANAADSAFHETFHFRHAIVLFALVWVAASVGREREAVAHHASPRPLEDHHAVG